jgi:hypothetical protein
MSDQNNKSPEAAAKDDDREAKVRQKLGFLKEELIRQKEGLKEIKDLIGREIETHYETDLWELSGKELDQEMGKLLTSLNEDVDCLALQKITSHRKIMGSLIVPAKRIIAGILRPFIGAYLAKQRQFNQNTIRFQLATFIRSRRLEKKLEGIEKIAAEIEEQQDVLLDAIRSLSERLGENGPKR